MTLNAKPSVLVLNGPNLNLLGTREPELYGNQTLDDIAGAVGEKADELGLAVEFRQSNNEGELIDWIHQAKGRYDAIMINAGAYTHTSVAILDALKACGLAVVEVHLSNIYRREEFRRRSYVSLAAHGVICGFGGHGYSLALEAIYGMIESD